MKAVNGEENCWALGEESFGVVNLGCQDLARVCCTSDAPALPSYLLQSLLLPCKHRRHSDIGSWISWRDMTAHLDGPPSLIGLFHLPDSRRAKGNYLRRRLAPKSATVSTLSSPMCHLLGCSQEIALSGHSRLNSACGSLA